VLAFNFHDEKRIVFKRGKNTKKQEGTFLSTLKIVPCCCYSLTIFLINFFKNKKIKKIQKNIFLILKIKKKNQI
jgi:hypothetical protein